MLVVVAVLLTFIAVNCKEYTIDVKTADVHGAGTNGKVYIIIKGLTGSSTSTIQLSHNGDPFERASTDTFHVTGSDVGVLREIKIWHGGEDWFADWFLEAVTVKDSSPTSPYVFQCKGVKADEYCWIRDDNAGDTPGQEAVTLYCKVDGNWGSWTSWSNCDVTCGWGERTRRRYCNNPSPERGGKDCEGSSTGVGKCLLVECPVNGGWGNWMGWSSCSKTCGDGLQINHRTCSNPPPQYGGSDCVGDKTKTRTCTTDCSVDGGWSDWSVWGECSTTCGDGTQARTRNCSNPAPAHGGKNCADNERETRSCKVKDCPVDGGWSNWTTWEVCSITCGNGTRTRSRTCTNPTPLYGGETCKGDENETRSCMVKECPVNGGWSDWSQWGDCTVSCGGGTQFSSRNCTNPAPEHGGSDCNGSSNRTKECQTQACPVNGGWTQWGDWGSCSASCDDGTKSRNRSCTNPTPAFRGNPCSGNITQTISCNLAPCPIDGGWGVWSNWSDCSVTCGAGVQISSRKCTSPEPSHGGHNCSGNNTKMRSCVNGVCAVDGGWTDWGPWSACSATCGGGTQEQNRSCTNPAPAHGGRQCEGDGLSSKTCNTVSCAVDGGWSTWGSWQPCDVTCGQGTRTSTRDCDNPKPSNGGRDCDGSAVQKEKCTRKKCPLVDAIDGKTRAQTDGAAAALSTGAIVGIVVAIIVVIILVIVIIVVVLRRRNRSDKSTPPSMPHTPLDDDAEFAYMNNVYEELPPEQPPAVPPAQAVNPNFEDLDLKKPSDAQGQASANSNHYMVPKNSVNLGPGS